MIYIHKKASINFKLSEKSVNGNVSEIKLVTPDKPFVLIFELFPFLKGNLN